MLKFILLFSFVLIGCSKKVEIPFNHAKATLNRMMNISGENRNNFQNSKVFKELFFIKENTDSIYKIEGGESYNIWGNGQKSIKITLKKMKTNKTEIRVQYFDFVRILFIPIVINPGLIKEKQFINEFRKEAKKGLVLDASRP